MTFERDFVNFEIQLLSKKGKKLIVNFKNQYKQIAKRIAVRYAKIEACFIPRKYLVSILRVHLLMEENDRTEGNPHAIKNQIEVATLIVEPVSIRYVQSYLKNKINSFGFDSEFPVIGVELLSFEHKVIAKVAYKDVRPVSREALDGLTPHIYADWVFA